MASGPILKKVGGNVVSPGSAASDSGSEERLPPAHNSVKQNGVNTTTRSYSSGIGERFEYSGWVYHLGVNKIGHEYCHFRFLSIRGKYLEMYKRDPHENPGTVCCFLSPSLFVRVFFYVQLSYDFLGFTLWFRWILFSVNLHGWAAIMAVWTLNELQSYVSVSKLNCRVSFSVICSNDWFVVRRDCSGLRQMSISMRCRIGYCEECVVLPFAV